MAYIQVPVPEDLVEDVMQYVLRLIARANLMPWDHASLVSFYADIDEPSKALLACVATATVDGSPISEQDAANTIQLNRREMAGILREVNDLAEELNRPNLLVRRGVDHTLPNGQRTQLRILSMGDDVARLIVDIDRAHLLENG